MHFSGVLCNDFLPLGCVVVGLGSRHPLTESLHQKMEQIKGDDKVLGVPKDLYFSM